MSLGGFIKRNLVALVMIPLIFGSHYGWYKLQEVDNLVSAEERNKLPITKLIKDFGFTSDSK